MRHATGKVMDRLINWLKEQAKQPKLFLLDIIIAGLTVICVFMIGFALEEASYSFHYYDEDSFFWRLESEEYASMVTMYYTNVAEGKENVKELQEYYGVARYFEAASEYKMYTEAGKEDLAKEALKAMEDAYAQMGDFSIVREKIHKKLGIE